MTGELKRENLVTWLELRALELGTPNQMERWIAKLLPEDELTALARKEIFSGLDTFKRWKNVSEEDADADIKHTGMCEAIDTRPPLVFDTLPAYHMTHDEWDTMKKIQSIIDTTAKRHVWCADGGCTIKMKPQAHNATCARCNKGRSYATALVTVEWAGRTLTREYAL